MMNMDHEGARREAVKRMSDEKLRNRANFKCPSLTGKVAKKLALLAQEELDQREQKPARYNFDKKDY